MLGLVMVWGCATAAELPTNENVTVPYFGVEQGGPVAPHLDQFLTWVNRSKAIGECTYSFGTGSDWNSLTENWSWFYPPASAWVQEAPGHVVAISVPILPGPTNDSGPTTGPNAGQPVSLAQGATGAYNSYFFAMGQQLVANHLQNSILRLGWEFNGNWYAWSVATDADAKNFAAYWKQIVNTLRTVPGQNFLFCWNGSNAQYVGSTPPYPLADAFPAGNDASGKPYVDMVGDDIYDVSWSYYPWATNATPAQILADQQNVWANVTNTTNQYWGIPSWTAIAKANNIPFAVPEWGISTDIHSGGDNTYFIQQMYNFIQNPANNVYYHSYYDSEGSKISTTDGFVTTLVNSAALYRQLYSLISPPTGLAVKVSNGAAVLTWSAVAGATSYTILRATSPGGSYVTVASGVTGGTYIDSAINSGVIYYYAVASNTSTSQGDASTAVSAAIPGADTPVMPSWALWVLALILVAVGCSQIPVMRRSGL